MMFMDTSIPNKDKVLLFNALNEELKRRGSLEETTRYILAARFVDGFDFDNTAMQHKSVGGWANMILEEIEFA